MTNPNLESAIEKLKLLAEGKGYCQDISKWEAEEILTALKPKPVDVDWKKLRKEFYRKNDVAGFCHYPKDIFDWFLANIPQNQAVGEKNE